MRIATRASHPVTVAFFVYRWSTSQPLLSLIRAAAVAISLVAIAPVAGAGPVILGGDDLPLHGCYISGANQKGWLYIQKAINEMYTAGCITRVNDQSIAALGVADPGVTAPTGQCGSGPNGGSAIHYAAEVALAKTVRYYDGATAINQFFTDLQSGATRPAIIWICSGFGDLSNGLDCPELIEMNTHAIAIRDFVNSGGGLLAHTGVPRPDLCATTSTWLPTLIPGLSEVMGCNSSGATLTTDGTTAFPGLSNSDINGTAGPCHSHFEGPVGSLKVLALDGAVPAKNYILGGGCQTVIGGAPCSDSGLVVHYAFDDPANRGLDGSPVGTHTGTVGAARVVAGQCGSALRFGPNNNAHEFNATSASDLNIVGPMTGMAWIRPRGPQSTDNSPGCTEGTIFSKGGNYWFQVEKDNDQLFFQQDGGSSFVIADASLPVGEWSHVAFVRDADGLTIHLYVDGVELAPLTGSILFPGSANSAPFMVGNYGSGSVPSACEFNGDIDEIKLYNRAFTPAQILAAYGCPCDSSSGPCGPVDSLKISTGWDQVTSSVVPLADVDNEWMAVFDPDNTTKEPRPAFTIPPYLPPAWANPFPYSQWISSYPTAADDLNGHYVFEYRFCLLDTIGSSLWATLRADDEARVFLNGTLLGTTGTESFRPANPALTVTTSAGSLFRAGGNTLRVDVQNIYSHAMGLNLVGGVAGHVPQYYYCCSDSANGLIGKVWHDQNGDGIRQGGEPPLTGWTVTSTSKSTTSDALGNWYLMGLAAGYHTVTVSVPSDWSRTAPKDPFHKVYLSSGDVEKGLDFGFIKNVDRPDPRRYDGPDDCALSMPQPNPFTGKTALRLTLTKRARVTARAFDLNGRLIVDLSPGVLPAGEHQISWNGRRRSGIQAAPGVYLFEVEVAGRKFSRRIILLH